MTNYMERDYRLNFGGDLKTYYLTVKESDLAICLPDGVWNEQLAAETHTFLLKERGILEHYIATDPEFLTTHQPHVVPSDAPYIAQLMSQAGQLAGTGPMAAVAGALAQSVGKFLLLHTTDVVVENGGDLFVASPQERLIGIFAGPSPLSNQVAIKLKPEQLPLGVCTSSGTVGHSFSYGVADAAVVLSPDAALADAVATATGNLVKSEADVAKAVEFALAIKNITAALVIKGETIAAAGALELAPYK